MVLLNSLDDNQLHPSSTPFRPGNSIHESRTLPSRGASPRRSADESQTSDPFATTAQNTASLAVPASDVNPLSGIGSRQVGSYHVGRPVGGGTMGDVFKAVHETSGETVALKLIRPSDGLRPSERDRQFFLREVAILSRLNHPRIVGIKDFGEACGQLYIAMEHVETLDLRHELQHSELSQQIRLVTGIGCYILHGLAHAHSQSVVHRDIKPANLLIHRNADQANKIGVKIADFGISKDVRNAGLSGMTRYGEMRGTPAFMSPEQIANSRDAGPASDVYSTASVLYYFLTGTVPHQETQDTPVELCRIVEGSPAPIRSRRTDLPEQLCNVIDRALMPLDQGRYATAIDFNQALLRFTRKPS